MKKEMRERKRKKRKTEGGWMGGKDGKRLRYNEAEMK